VHDIPLHGAQNGDAAAHAAALEDSSPCQPLRPAGDSAKQDVWGLHRDDNSSSVRQPGDRASTLSELCRQGPPTPNLDALGAAEDVDLEAIAAQHPVRVFLGSAA
jgi:hypothetical protein